MVLHCLQWQLLALMLIPLIYLVYKNKLRARKFLVSFIKFEGLLIIEVRPINRFFDVAALLVCEWFRCTDVL